MKLYKHPTYKIHEYFYKKYFLNKKNVRIIDSGCGNGYILDLIGTENIQSYLGYDINKNAIKEGKNKYKNYGNIKFEIVKQNQVLPVVNNKVDVIFSIGVLQYLNDNEISNFFKYCIKNLKNNGKVLVSCTTDHLIYKILNIYNIFLPSHTNNRSGLIKTINDCGLKVKYQKESGLILGPLFWHNIVVLFDVLDKILFRNKGKLGFFGNTSRILATIIFGFEHFIPIDYGYTLYMVLEKK